jgi:hypothetical protein
MNISIVYVNYKTARLILDSIKSVKEKTEDVDYEDWLAKGYTNQPLVSFIIESHNKSVGVKRIVSKLREYPNAEIVVIDDGSEYKHTKSLMRFLTRGNEFLVRANDLYENVMYDKTIRFAMPNKLSPNINEYPFFLNLL